MAAHMLLSLVVVGRFKTAPARRQNLKTSLLATVAIALLIGIPILISATVALTQTAPPAALRQRVVWPKPGKTILNPAKDKADVIVVKFREGTHVRERATQLEADLTNLSESEERLLQRADLPRQRLFQDLAQVNSLIGLNSKRFVRRLFTRPENELDVDKRTGEARVGEELADLNLYYVILVADAKFHETERLIDQLNALDAIEIAYPQPVLAAAETDIAQSASPAGFFPEARDVQVIDIGQSANLSQSDFEDAVSQATATLRAGDVMLIRQPAPGPDSGFTATCNVNQFESIAMEFWDANFDAIKHATAKGIVVIEAAGNGSMNLDSPVYNRKFDRSVRDSGAI